MSRIGREPIAVPAGVNVTIADGNVVGALELNSVCLLDYDRVGVAETKNDLAVLLLNSVSDANDFKLLLKATRYAYYHVVKKGSCETVECTVLLLIVGAGYKKLVALLCNAELSSKALGKLAKGTLDSNYVTLGDSYVYACGNRDRLSSYS